MDMAIQEARASRCGIKRPNSTESVPDFPKKPKMKLKARDAVRSLINLLRVKDKRKRSFPDDPYDGFVAEENINTKPLSTLSAFFSRNPFDVSCAGKNEETLSKSWAYFENESFNEIFNYENSSEEKDTPNCGESVFGECYFEDYYWNDYHDHYWNDYHDHYWNDYHVDVKEDLTSAERQAGRGIIMGVSVLQSLNTARYDDQETLQGCLRRNTIKRKSQRQRRSSLPNFATRCNFSPAPRKIHSLKKETTDKPATVTQSQVCGSNLVSCYMSNKNFTNTSNAGELPSSQVQRTPRRSSHQRNTDEGHTSYKPPSAAGKPPKQFSRTFTDSRIKPLLASRTMSSPDTRVRSLRPLTDTKIKSSTNTKIRSSTDTINRSLPDTRIRSSLDTRIRPSTDNRIRPLADTKIRSSTDIRIRSLPDSRIKPLTDIKIRSSTETKIMSLPDTRIRSSPDTRIRSSPDTRIRSSPDTRIRSSPDTRIRHSTDNRTTPSTDTKIRHLPDIRVSSLADTRNRPSTGTRIRLSTDTRIRPSTDTRIKLSSRFASGKKSDPASFRLATERNTDTSNKQDDTANSTGRSPSPKLQMLSNTRSKLNSMHDFDRNIPDEIHEPTMSSANISTNNKPKEESKHHSQHRSFELTCNFVKEGEVVQEGPNVQKQTCYQMVSAMPKCKQQINENSAKAAREKSTQDAQSDLSESPKKQSNDNYVSLAQEESAARLVSPQLKITLTPVNKIPTPLSTSSPMPVKQLPSEASRDALLSQQDFVSPVRVRCKMAKLKYSNDDVSPRSKRRRQRRRYLQQRLQLYDMNDNTISSSEENLEATSLSSADYLLLKKAADIIVGRINNKKEIKSYINMAAIVEYLRSQYMNEISKISSRKVQSISDYMRYVAEFSKNFNPSRLSLENCLPEILASVLTNSSKVTDACADYIFENLHFLISSPEFLHIPPELLLMLLENDRSFVLGHNGFPLSHKEAEREVQRVVKRYLNELKTGDLVKDSHLDKMFSIITHSKADQCKPRLPATEGILLSKRPFYDITYKLIRKHVNMNHFLLSEANSYLTVDPENSPRSVVPPESEMWNYCNTAYTLRKMYFSYKRHNKAPYITHISLQFAVRGKKVLYSIGDSSSDAELTGGREAALLHQHNKLTVQSTNTLCPKEESADSNQVAVVINSSTLAAISEETNINTEHSKISSQRAEESNTRRTAIKLIRGEHVTGVMVQEKAALHNVMVITNKGRYIRAHGILEFPGRTGWTLLPPPQETKYCLQAIHATIRTDPTRITCLGAVGVVWAVVTCPLNNLNR